MALSWEEQRAGWSRECDRVMAAVSSWYNSGEGWEEIGTVAIMSHVRCLMHYELEFPETSKIEYGADGTTEMKCSAEIAELITESRRIFAWLVEPWDPERVYSSTDPRFKKFFVAARNAAMFVNDFIARQQHVFRVARDGGSRPQELP